MTDFGRVKPVYGNWRWPFRQMEVGDRFHVAYQDRDPEEVRKLASVRAAQLGVRMSCRRDDEEGVFHVERVAFGDRADKLPAVLDWLQLRAMLREEYEVDGDAIPWSKAVEVGESFTHRAERVGSDPRNLVECEIAGYRYAVELGRGTISATVMGRGEALSRWKERKLAAMME